MSNARNCNYKKQWAVFAPDGYIQFRTISDTRKEAIARTPRLYEEKEWKDYKAAGFFCKKVSVKISVIKN